jgi:hypothetical protein
MIGWVGAGGPIHIIIIIIVVVVLILPFGNISRIPLIKQL